MIQLIYISSATRVVTDAGVSEILEVSRRRNHAAAVTGLLLYDGRRFLQALEGNEESVAPTFQRIQADPRHRAIVLLSSKHIRTKAFGSWAMAAQVASPTASAGGDLVEQIDALTANVTDLDLQAYFRSFARVRVAA